MNQIIYNNILNINPLMSKESVNKTIEHYSELDLNLCILDPKKINNYDNSTDETHFILLFTDQNENYLVDTDGIHELPSDLFESISKHQKQLVSC